MNQLVREGATPGRVSGRAEEAGQAHPPAAAANPTDAALTRILAAIHSAESRPSPPSPRSRATTGPLLTASNPPTAPPPSPSPGFCADLPPSAPWLVQALHLAVFLACLAAVSAANSRALNWYQGDKCHKGNYVRNQFVGWLGRSWRPGWDARAFRMHQIAMWAQGGPSPPVPPPTPKTAQTSPKPTASSPLCLSFHRYAWTSATSAW